MFREPNPESWFKASDFTLEGTPLTIKEVKSVEIESDKHKLVVFFHESPKGLVLNEVNFRIIEKNTGESDTDNWKGYQIIPYASTVLFNGAEHPCIRIKILINTKAQKIGK